MIGKSFSHSMILGFVLLVSALLVVVSPAGAEDNKPAVVPVDAELDQYIASHDGQEMAAVDVKLGYYNRDTVDYVAAADPQTFRWQAMGDWYAAHDMLNFSYAQAAENQAFRWQAMGDWYAAHDRLNFSYAQAAENQAFRWQAMGDWYARHGQMNEAAAVEQGGILYAMDTIDLKLFNSVETSTAYVPAAVASIVYAMD